MYGKIDADTIVGEEEMEVVDYETAERFDIDVSFDDKDEAKRLGARWDVPKKQWYVEGDKYRKNPERWVRWNPVAVSTSSTPAPF